MHFFSSGASFVDQRVNATYNWFENIVVGQKLCPFAPPLQRDPELMRVVSSPENVDRRQSIDLVREEAHALVGTEAAPAHETTLIILDTPEWSRDYREFVRLSWDLQEQVVEEAGLVGTLQLVLFHPLATHQTYAGWAEEEDAADYTIRSPYPTVHLLREVDVLQAVQGGYPNLETLPMRNQAKLIQQGSDACKRRLEECSIFTR